VPADTHREAERANGVQQLIGSLEERVAFFERGFSAVEPGVDGGGYLNLGDHGCGRLGDERAKHCAQVALGEHPTQ
jgi:hypothetical protein